MSEKVSPPQHAYTLHSGALRPFQITGGLQEGYAGHGRTHSLLEVAAAHADWQEETDNILGGMIAPATVSYAFPWQGKTRAAQEPGWALWGMVNPLYQTDLSDEEAMRRVLSLAMFLAGRLGQTRVYVSCGDVAVIVERSV